VCHVSQYGIKKFGNPPCVICKAEAQPGWTTGTAMRGAAAAHLRTTKLASQSKRQDSLPLAIPQEAPASLARMEPGLPLQLARAGARAKKTYRGMLSGRLRVTHASLLAIDERAASGAFSPNP
jgi:hypothetical protein